MPTYFLQGMLAGLSLISCEAEPAGDYLGNSVLSHVRVLPMVARVLRLDPAVLVSPVLASVVDISGMLIYFFTVTKLVGV